jgi:hypothetical protein
LKRSGLRRHHVDDLMPLTRIGELMALALTAFNDHTRQWMTSSRTACAAALLLAATACTSSTAAPSSTQTVRGDVSDPAGDTLSDPRVPVAPDLVRATADVAAGNITFVLQFAPGTLDRQTTRVSVLLDTDQDGSTGIRQAGGIGADYNIDVAAATSQAAITRADPVSCAAQLSCFVAAGSVAVTFTSDSVQVGVPLSLLGSDDGRLSFQASAYALVAPLTPVVFDSIPNSGLPPARVQ